jgi:hypothetical protein
LAVNLIADIISVSAGFILGGLCPFVWLELTSLDNEKADGGIVN